MRRWHNSYPRRYGYRKAAVIFIFIFVFVLFLDHQLRPIYESVATNQAKAQSVALINSAVAEELQKNTVSYTDLVTVERNNSGEILAITTNMVKMNELKAVIMKDVQEQLGDDAHANVGVPLGTLLGNDFIHGVGPKIPLRVSLNGNINADFKSSFESAGINQTKHQIYLNIHTSVYSFIPGFNTTTEVETNIPVAETIIVGQVPQVFANVN